MRTNREAFVPTSMMSELMGGRSHFEINRKVSERTNRYGLEERGFLATLTMLEMRWGNGRDTGAGLGKRTMEGLGKMIRATLDMSLSRGEVREALAKNVDIWMRLQRIFYLAVPILVSRSLRESYTENGAPSGLDVSESVNLILKNYDVLVEDLGYLNNLLVVSRNMLAVKETAQEICRAVGLDKQVHKLIILCVNVTSKGYDGENVDEASRGRLNEITELCKHF
jgi:palmitoyltransferase